ncbi:hypothetical protein DRH29_00045 [candidate division Kazan bacterium]|uniref:Histidine phosphatase family protein n=1 Tax=candidate division Kazan bacterium TaxID=2202143 RepID=A0A420ZDH3_UNCK3|nr:MAG: hypothetical protein DRH29_00045 [candidate division Kazan bacterium]
MNVAGLSQGPVTKSHLTERGREQSAKLAEKLRDTKIDLAFISSADRTRQTAEIILTYHPDAKINFSSQLLEKNPGKFAGRPTHELREAWRASDLPFGEFQPEGGESWYQAGRRVVDFIEKLIKKYKGSDSTILIVGHGGVLTYLFMWSDKFDPRTDSKEKYDHYHVDNTAVSVIEVDHNGQPILASINDTSHLD